MTCMRLGLVSVTAVEEGPGHRKALEAGSESAPALPCCLIDFEDSGAWPILLKKRSSGLFLQLWPGPGPTYPGWIVL